MRKHFALAAISGAAVAIVALTALWRPTPLLVWNASASVPIGLYAVRPVGIARVGELVVARPPEPLAAFLADGRYLPEGVPLIKHIAALPGQTVCRDGFAVSVDGRVVADARKRDRAGRELPFWSGCRSIAPREVFLLNASEPASLDGRYFGPLPDSSIVGRAVPLWTNEAR